MHVPKPGSRANPAPSDTKAIQCCSPGHALKVDPFLLNPGLPLHPHKLSLVSLLPLAVRILCTEAMSGLLPPVVGTAAAGLGRLAGVRCPTFNVDVDLQGRQFAKNVTPPRSCGIERGWWAARVPTN